MRGVSPLIQVTHDLIEPFLTAFNVTDIAGTEDARPWSRCAQGGSEQLLRLNTTLSD
jgi:hypothetical protein